MVVQSLTCNDELKNGFVFEGVPDISHNPVLPRRTSARVKKLQAEKALKQSVVVEEERRSEKRLVPKRRVIPKPKTKRNDSANLVDGGEGSSDNAEIDELLKALLAYQKQTDKSDSAKATETIRTFNKLYLYFTKEEEKRAKAHKEKIAQAPKKKKTKGPKDDQNDGKKGPSKKRKRAEDDTKNCSKRPDLKAMSKILNTKAALHQKKILGAFPGIEPGYQFFSRAEMVVVGFHAPPVSGIDYIGIGETTTKDYSRYKLPLAVSIVMSGQYEDDQDDSEHFWFTGQGGNDFLGNKQQVQAQELVRGNLALKNSEVEGTPVRVVRGHDSKDSYARKVYTYDGLYKVTESSLQIGKSGYPVYKFRLKRLEDQPPLTTTQVYFTRGGLISQSISEIPWLVCKDISGGQENLPIPATNKVDDTPFPPEGFKYQTTLQVAENVKIPENAKGCECKGVCNDPKKCACARLNGSDFPYVHYNGGRLIVPRSVVFECGPQCGCGPNCVNRTSQKGLRYHLEVFRTLEKGWGVRSWNYIPSGAPICEYIGVLMKTEDVKANCDDTYIFDIDCLQTMKGMDGREKRLDDVAVPSLLEKIDENSAPEFCIDGGSIGNVSRFINHSCQPNLFVQCVLSSHHDAKLARIVLVAADNIPPMTELSYDYGYAVDSVLGADGKPRQMACFCGAEGCRKRLL